MEQSNNICLISNSSSTHCVSSDNFEWILKLSKGFSTIETLNSVGDKVTVTSPSGSCRGH